MRHCVLPILLALAAPATAGELNDLDIDEHTRWRPSACAKPEPPRVGAIGGVPERNKVVREFNAYAQGVNDYLTCAVAEANADLAAFRKIVSESLEAEKSQLKAESEQLKASIESGGQK
jgi:hypothetical protein